MATRERTRYGSVESVTRTSIATALLVAGIVTLSTVPVLVVGLSLLAPALLPFRVSTGPRAKWSSGRPGSGSGPHSRGNRPPIAALAN